MNSAAIQTKSEAPCVSVLMPVYNAARYLPEAIESVLGQTFDDFELITVDDGSTDGSLAILRDHATRDARLRVISRPNTGIVGALNDGLAAARGPYIGRMDADDTCDATRLVRQVAYLDGHRSCVAVGTWVTRTDPYGSPVAEQTPPVDHAAIDAALLRAEGGAMVHATMLIRREALERVGGWRAQYNWVEDLDLCLRLGEVGELANVPAALYRYRRHAESVCATRYEQMCRSLQALLDETYARRGLGAAPNLYDVRPDLTEKEEGVAHQYRMWACHALARGEAGLARRHAWAALRHEPWSPRSWRVAYWALAA